MRRIKTLFGGLALLLLAISMNVTIWERSLSWLYITAGLSAVCALGWLVASAVGLGGGAVLQGRAVGAFSAVAGSVLFLGICIVCYAMAERYGRPWDVSQEGRRALADQTKLVLENMTREVEVLYFCLESEDRIAQISKAKTLRFLDQCCEYTRSGLLKVRQMDPHLDQAAIVEMGITHLSPQGTVVVKSGSRQKVIWFTGGSPRLEERDFTNALINVLRDAEPKLYFLTGHGERRIDDDNPTDGASMLKKFLEGESYKAEPLGIKLSDPEVPEDCDLLVINGLREDLSAGELQAIEAYLKKGGRLLLLVEPWMLENTARRGDGLRNWMEEQLGIQLGRDIVLGVPEKRTVAEAAQNVAQVQLSADGGPFAALENETPDAYHGCYSAQHPLTRSFDQVMLLQLSGTVNKKPTAPKGVAAEEILRTPPGYWAETDLVMLSKEGTAEPSTSERQGPLSLAVAAAIKTSEAVGDTGQTEEGRVVVIGNEGFASNGQIATFGGNLNFLLNAVAWLTQHEDLIAIRPSGTQDSPLLVAPAEERAITWVAVLLTLQLVLLPGAVVYIVRRRNR